MMRLQLKEIYPDFSNAEADELLQRAGGNAQVHIDQLKQQFQQLNTDLSSWIDQGADDVNDYGASLYCLGGCRGSRG